MRNFIEGEVYFMRKDAMFKGICMLFLIGSVGLLLLIGMRIGIDATRPLESLVTVASFSPFFYFIIPIHACFFITEGFEYGSVKNIIASGQSRPTYIIGKYLTEIITIIWFIIQFFGVFYLLFMAAVLITGSPISNIDLVEDGRMVARTIAFNILYLSAYSAVVVTIGIFIKKTAPALMVTFFFIFGDFMITGYLEDNSSVLLRFISHNTLTSQIMKFSGANSQRIQLWDTNDYVHMTVIPFLVIAICSMISLVTFEKRDIHI